MNSHSASYTEPQSPDTFGAANMSIVLISPDDLRRRAAAEALALCPGNDVREFSSYPPGLDDVPRLLEQHHDVIIIDLDSDPEYALELVESIGANGTATVMVYSAKADAELLVRCMRAGAREFLTLPFSHSTMAEALVRASARRPSAKTAKAVTPEPPLAPVNTSSRPAVAFAALADGRRAEARTSASAIVLWLKGKVRNSRAPARMQRTSSSASALAE